MKKRKQSQDDDLLVSYLNRSAPVQWVAWWTDLAEGKEKSKFASLIFEKGQLRSLINFDTRASVIDFIKDSRRLRQIALTEAKETVEKIASIATQSSKDQTSRR